MVRDCCPTSACTRPRAGDAGRWASGARGIAAGHAELVRIGSVIVRSRRGHNAVAAQLHVQASIRGKWHGHGTASGCSVVGGSRLMDLRGNAIVLSAVVNHTRNSPALMMPND